MRLFVGILVLESLDSGGQSFDRGNANKVLSAQIANGYSWYSAIKLDTDLVPPLSGYQQNLAYMTVSNGPYGTKSRYQGECYGEINDWNFACNEGNIQ